MNPSFSAVIFPTTDAAASKEVLRTVLATEPYVDAPYYVGFRTGDLEFGLNPHGAAQGLDRAVPYWDVADIQEALARVTESGARILHDARDVGQGLLVAEVTDGSGNIYGFRQSPK